ncbi:MAG: glycoside hydrolase family 5 protein [Eubacterium sp.]|nr:glycoside hydrolase family 5 protein [Eubacterium sp.]
MNKWTKKISVILFSLAASMLFFANQGQAKTPVEKWGQLRVQGTYMTTQSGKKVQLKGVSTHGIAWFPQYIDKTGFSSLKKMGVNTIRLAFYSDPGAGYSKSLYQKVDEGVQYATELGMYVIIDWHILNDGNPKKYEKNAKKFFSYFAKKYGKQKNILYEICNEPNGNVTWTKDIRPYANRMIKQIRKYDKKNIIIVGTPTWSQDVDVVSEKPLKQKNIMYALHFYAATHKADLRNKLKTAHQNGLPVFVSEFSICDASGNGAIDKKSADQWMKLLNQYKIGYVSWNLSNKAETSSLLKNSCSKTGNFKKSDLSKSGVYIYKYWKKK